ncbi:MAG: crotonase/enoyl-CoA hydratase family protein [Thiopseudomonas sp.]|nr:crotonase/enoyl-CoA hydratase family protein [Thiopseudomonas sp.]
MNYHAFNLQVQDKIAVLEMNRPAKLNAMNEDFWRELPEIFAYIEQEPSIRVVVLTGAGEHFSSGIDLNYLASVAGQLGQDPGRNALILRKQIKHLQASLDAVDRCGKPVLAAVQGYCIGGAVDLISACDMRYCSADARFSIKEIDIGMAADVGTLQRLPHIIGDGIMRELAYTGRFVEADEACRIGLVNRVYADPSQLLDGVLQLSAEIAAKSPLAVRGTKEMIRYMRDHSVEDGLNYVATWNAAMLQSEDLRLAMAAGLSKRRAEFKD